MFPKAIKIFSLQGFDIKVDPSWLLIAALITWSLSSQYFPFLLPGSGSDTYLAMALVAMTGFFGSLILHELSHSIVARKFGVRIKGITLFIFGGVAELDAEPEEASAEFWIALAGPMMSLILALGFWMLASFGEMLGFPAEMTIVLDYLALINLVLALFNLVPAFPLDGGRILRAVLWQRTGDLSGATQTAARSGAFFGYFLIVLGVLSLFHGQQIGGLWQILIGVFLLVAAKSSAQQQLMKTALGGKAVHSMMTADPVTVAPELSLAELVNQVMLRHRVSFVPVVEDGNLLGYVDTRILSGIERANWSNTQVGDIFLGRDDICVISPDMPANDLMTHIARTGQRKFLVAQGSRLVGVITLSDMLGYIAVLQGIGQIGPKSGMMNTPPRKA